MTLLDIQRRIREAGRIRIGQQVPTSNGKTRPAKLDTFRLTSPDRRAIEQAAGMYGGRPEEWDAPAGRQWQVITEVDELDVIVPPSDMAFSQHYELWSGGGCQRRCDGVTEQLTDGPCLCDPDARECTPHTRLSVMLRELVGLGVWRLDTQGFYAAVELGGAVQVVQAAAGAGVMLPARLRLEQRQIKRPGQPTRNFAVPTLDVHVTPEQLFGGQAGGMSLTGGSQQPSGQLGSQTAALPQGGEPAVEPAKLTPVPETVTERPAKSVQDQVADVAGQGAGVKRAGAAAPVPSTGLKPRTAAQAEAGTAPERAEPEGVAPIDGEDLEALSVDELRDRLRGWKDRLKPDGVVVKLGGAKADLIARLQQLQAEHGDSAGTASQKDDQPAPPPPDDGEQPQQTVDPDGPCTEGQRRKLFAVLHEHGITEAQRKAVIRHGYGVDSLNDVPAGKVAKLIDALEREGGADQFRAYADEWLEAQADGADQPQSPEPGPDACAVCGVPIAGEHDCPGPPTEEPSDAAQQPEQPTPAERAYARADGDLDALGRLQQRIRGAFKVLAVHRPKVYEGARERLQTITGQRAADTDWSGASESQLAALAEDLERAAEEALRGEETADA